MNLMNRSMTLVRSSSLVTLFASMIAGTTLSASTLTEASTPYLPAPPRVLPNALDGAKGGPGEPLSIPAENFVFTYMSQSGEEVYSCRHHMNNEVLKDWEVVCGDEKNPASLKRFTVHFRMWYYLKSQAPKIVYNTHFWVTNHQAKMGSGGKYVGSTLYFHLDDVTALRVLDITQDVEDTYMLQAKIQL